MASLNIIFGGGGVAREVAWLMSTADPKCEPDLFVVSDRDWIADETIDGIPTIADRKFETLGAEPVNAYVAIGIPSVRRALHKRLLHRPATAFPSLIHALSCMDRRPGKVQIGLGVVVYPTASLTTEVLLGDFVQVNPSATLGHGSTIGPYTTICPGANVSGNVTIGSGCFIGAGCVIREGITICDDCVIGAGAVVVRNIDTPGTWVGVPAEEFTR
ncbi:MAG TPA: acetyltransferase [Rhodanobacteraceae bacterium]|jgi:sugar O-acyltransferase (sialic acid O-acetyltransferase NeuD family)|nr:acetyltransferase [Rhodanobacteraceae bacterium]